MARRVRARLVVLALAVVAVYAGIVLLAGVRPLAEALSGMRPAGVLLALAVVVVAYSIRSARWGIYLRRLRVLAPRGPIGPVVAFAMGLPQGKWGQVVKAWALNARAALPLARSVPAVLAERMSDVAGAFLFLAVGLVAAPGAHVGLLLALGGIGVLLVLTLRSVNVARAFVALFRWVPWVRRHEESALSGHARLREQLHARELAWPSLVGFVAFLLEGVVLWALAVQGLGLPLSFAEALLVAAVTDAAGMVVVVPGGLGAAEGSMLALLALRDVPLPEAAALTLLYRASVLWFGILLGVLGVVALRVMPADRPVAASASARR